MNEPGLLEHRYTESVLDEMAPNLRSYLPFHVGERRSENNPNDTTTRLRNQDPTPFPGSSLLPPRLRKSVIAAAAEFIGTFMFLFFAFGGTQVANSTAFTEDADAVLQGSQNHTITQRPNTSILLFIALSFGFSLAVNVWVFFRVSGGLFNPAVRVPPLSPDFRLMTFKWRVLIIYIDVF